MQVSGIEVIVSVRLPRGLSLHRLGGIKTMSKTAPNKATTVVAALLAAVDPVKSAHYPKFFRTGKGEYGEGDVFIGVVVPTRRAIAKQYRHLPLEQVARLLDHAYHECRMTALFILIDQYHRGDTTHRQAVVDLYFDKIERVNNWDLVDCSASKILGRYLSGRPKPEQRRTLGKLARADHLWRQRIAMVATWHFIQNGEFQHTLRIAKRLLTHEHDLIHKAVGWMLREMGKRDEQALVQFLERNYANLPRTTLRYAIEKFSKERRNAALRGDFA